MADSYQDRLLPCLLDRLRDDEPRNSKESRSDRVVSLSEYRQHVLRDITWLFNTGRKHEDLSADEFPQVAKSVIAYGIPDLGGVVSESIDLSGLERQIRQALIAFEPRINPHSLAVKAIEKEVSGDRPGASLVFEIKGDLFANPIPEKLFAKTEIDLETGQCHLKA